MSEIKTSQKGVHYAPPQTLKTKKRVYSQALLMRIPHDHEEESDISLKIGRYTLPYGRVVGDQPKSELTLDNDELTALIKYISENYNPFEDFIHDFYASRSDNNSQPNETILGALDWSQNANTLIYPLIGMLDKNYDLQKSFIEKYKKWQENPFKGYNESGSDMPPKGKAPEGRINPEMISYLYLAEDAQTCVYEVRPIIGQNVSVATFVTQKKLRIYNLAYKFPNDYPNEEKLNISLFEYVCQQFSKPYTGKPLQYLPTQFLSEVIKNMGFDGLRFNSSLNQGGYNIVLFNNEFCKPVSSDFVRIDAINLTIGNPDLYILEDVIKEQS